ncbi:prepilin peptidase [uncultured Massilia sp.]|uniref:prepilin peptidase n=1 Tax=uncultured Massilia sp. TaxID=169973 RepID=UPI0025FABACD|nr:prepilin peptidase [uncultured Massilia sp.]
MPTEPMLQAALLLLVCAAAINDVATRRIPNRLLLAGLAGALVLRLLSAAPGAALLDALAGAAVGLLLFLPFYLLRGMAAGDVKLMAVVGAFAGPRDAITIAVLAWCAGGVMALLLVLARGRLRLAVRNIVAVVRGALVPGMALPAAGSWTSAGAIPYGVAIAAGTIAVLVRQYA